MTSVRPIFRVLRESPDMAADAALVTALEHADPVTAQAIVAILLERKKKPGLFGLLARLHLLDESLRRSLAGEIDTLFSVLREAAQSRNEQVHLNALEMIRRGRAYRASYLLENSFHDASARVREAAGETLCYLAGEILASCPSPPDPQTQASMTPDDMHTHMAVLEACAEDRRQFIAAVEAGLSLFEIHRQPRVIEVAMWFVDDLGSKFWSLITAPNSRTAQVALRIFSEGLTPRLVPFAMTALSYAQFRPRITPALSQCTAPDVLAEWLRQSWRLLQPKTARAMTVIKDLTCLDHRAADLLHVPQDAQRFIGRWLFATGLPSECKADAMLEVLHRGGRSARGSVVWAATQWNDEVAVPFLRNLSTDVDPELSRLVRYEMARRRQSDYPVSELLDGVSAATNTSPTPVARAVTFDRYWAGFDRLDDACKVKIGRELIATTPAFPMLLSRKLEDAEPAVCLRALNVIRVLGMAEQFAEQLQRMAHDSNPELRSAVMSILAQLPGGTTKRLLHSALCDEDPRVRANAIEAVEQTDGEDIVDILLPMLGSPDNRVRANAVKALLKQGVRPAAETLLKMIDDPDRVQRISALWLVDRMGLFGLAAKIARIAACDEDPQVRLRAQKIVERLRRTLAASRPPADSASHAAEEVIAK